MSSDAARPNRIATKIRGDPDLGGADFPEVPSGWPFRNSYDFMEGKRKDDGVPPDLHRIHDHYYDLSGFAKHHPGGERWISLTRGTDITELFETHHLNFERVSRMLPSFLADEEAGGPPSLPRNSPFTFDEDGFYATLRAKVWNKFGGEARRSGASKVAALGPSDVSKYLADSLVMLSLAMTIAAGRASGASMGVLAALTGLLNGSFIGVGHNFMHQEDSFRRHYQDISGFSSSEFRMHHALSHHPYTNCIVDVETNQLRPSIDFYPTTEKRSLTKRVVARVALATTNAIALPSLTLRRLIKVGTGNFEGDSQDVAAQLIPVAQFATLATLQGSAKRGAAAWLIMKLATSNLFLWANFLNGPHFNDECWHQGDTLDSRDWGLLQVQTNTERSEMSEKDNLKANLINIPTFNLHHLHHLFPTIDAAELSKIVPLFEEHCEEFGVTFDRMTNAELSAGMTRCIDGYAPNDRTRNGLRAKM